MQSYLKSKVALAIFISLLSLATSAQNPMVASMDAYLKAKTRTTFGLNWTQIGPVMNSARAEAVQGDPNNPGTFYVAFGSGNLWKTVNHGLTWKPIFEDQSAIGIGDFALAPADPQIIYVGTGESLKKPRNFTLPGTGVFRSNDGGETWTHLGLDDSYHIGEIVVHPTNPDIVFVAVMGHFWSANENRGVYRTIDGGKSWEKVLYIDENTGANDIVISPSNPKVIYASLWNNYPDIMGQNSGIYTSKDGGTTWSLCLAGLPTGDGIGRIGLAVSWQNPDKVYALFDNRDEKVKTTAQIYKSLDGGSSWNRTHKKDLNFMARLWYFADCYVNPQDDEEFWGLGVRAVHTTDGGESFDMLGGDVFHHTPSPAIPLHLDLCEMWINPLNPEQLLLGNDGGLYLSYDKGETWRHFNNIPAGEFYDISVDNKTPYNVYGGTQDNSSVYGPAKEWNPLYPDGWKYIWLDAWSGGDGCVTYPDPSDPNTVYTSSQNGGIFRKDLLADHSEHIRPRLPKGTKGKLNYNFIAPYVVSSHLSTRLYHAGNYVFKTDNRGDQWEVISPDLSVSASPEKASLAVGAIAESSLDPNLLFAGTDHGAFWVSQDQGQTWVERSLGLPNTYIRSIQPSVDQPDQVFLTMTGINYDDFNRYVYRSNDLGKTWEALGDDLPNEIVNCVLQDPIHPDILYLGGYRGCYISMDRGASWDLLGTNLAATCVADLVIQEREMDLLMGTHGRGIYKLDLEPIYHEYTREKANKASLFPIPTGTAPYYNDTHRDVNQESVKKTTFTVWLPQPEMVTIEVFKGRKLLHAIKFQGQSGINQRDWDLGIPQEDNGGAYFFRHKTYLSAGDYNVKLKGGKVKTERTWTVVKASYPYK